MTALALAVVAYAAVPASADITLGDGGAVYSDCVAGGTAQDCAIKGVRSGAAPTLVAGTTTITCQQANTNGVMNGDASGGFANATLNFSWSQCTTNTLVGCSVNTITGVPVNIDETNHPSATIINTATAGTTITCAGVFVCNASSDPSTHPVTAEIDQGSQVATIADTVAVTGSIGCPASGTGTWNAQYLITDASNNDLDLWATG
ncbi:MAG TPA: hypothetical protein VK486_08830 [Thermoleophilaceae bacterium]|nr:hypothetical protein [Thermoleophilaceae bacterium]